MVYKLRFILPHFAFRFGIPLKNFLLLSFIISAVTSNAIFKASTVSKLSAPIAEAPLITRVESSPQASPSPQARKPSQSPATVTETRIAAKSNNPLCKGVKDYWVLVPDPAHEGQYVICNTVADRMTTVDELNQAQNDYRRDHTLNTLNINQDLCTVAAERAREISTNFSHDGFEAAVERHSINKSSVGENIASGPLLGIHFVQWAWDKSPGHRENMLRDWSEGCGGVYDRFAVFIFAK